MRNRDLDWSNVVADVRRMADEQASTRWTRDLVMDVFRKYEITEASIATLPAIVADLAALVERMADETTELALANLTDPSCPAYDPSV